MKRAVVLGVFVSACLAGTAVADDPTVDRQALMKNVGAATGAGAKYMKGEAPFDLAAAQMIFKTWNNAALGFGYMFPEGSETGNETEASKAIWENRDGFNAAVAKFIQDTSANITDEASFKAAFGAAAANCKTCHEGFRVVKK